MTGSVLLIVLSVVAVGVALFFGLKNMMLGGSALISQKLMRLRVTLQAVAVFVIMVLFWWSSGSGA